MLFSFPNKYLQFFSKLNINILSLGPFKIFNYIIEQFLII